VPIQDAGEPARARSSRARRRIDSRIGKKPRQLIAIRVDRGVLESLRKESRVEASATRG
jgi:uncharacterized protein (DUF4415 family)